MLPHILVHFFLTTRTLAIYICKDSPSIALQNQKVSLGQLAGTQAQSWAETLCCGLHNWHVYWCVLTGNAVLRDALATVKGEMKGKVI